MSQNPPFSQISPQKIDDDIIKISYIGGGTENTSFN